MSRLDVLNLSDAIYYLYVFNNFRVAYTNVRTLNMALQLYDAKTNELKYFGTDDLKRALPT